MLVKVLFFCRALAEAAEHMADSSNLCPPCMQDLCPPTQPTNQDVGCSVFNNYIFHQDPETGRLSLLPVLVRASQSLPGLDINPSLVPHLFLNTMSVPGNSSESANYVNVHASDESEDSTQASSRFLGSAIISDLDSNNDSVFVQQKDAAKQDSALTSTAVHPALTEVIHLLKGEFSLDRYLDGGHEDVAMGM